MISLGCDELQFRSSAYVIKCLNRSAGPVVKLLGSNILGRVCRSGSVSICMPIISNSGRQEVFTRGLQHECQALGILLEARYRAGFACVARPVDILSRIHTDSSHLTQRNSTRAPRRVNVLRQGDRFGRTHSGGERCLHSGCERPGYERTLNCWMKYSITPRCAARRKGKRERRAAALGPWQRRRCLTSR